MSQADRLEAYEAFTSVVGRKAAGTLMNGLKDVDDGIVGLNHKVDVLTLQVDTLRTSMEARFSTLETQMNGIHNWLRSMVIGFLGFGATVVITVFQMR